MFDKIEQFHSIVRIINIMELMFAYERGTENRAMPRKWREVQPAAVLPPTRPYASKMLIGMKLGRAV